MVATVLHEIRNAAYALDDILDGSSPELHCSEDHVNILCSLGLHAR